MSKVSLQEARRLVERGWGQGFMRKRDMDDKISYCLVGALAESLCSGTDYQLVREALGSISDERGLTYWNDTPGRKKSEILEVLDKAIAAS